MELTKGVPGAVLGAGFLLYVLVDVLVVPATAPAVAASCVQTDTLDNVAHEVSSLVKMHDCRDPDGIPCWYVPRSLVRATEAQTEAIRGLQVTLREVSLR